MTTLEIEKTLSEINKINTEILKLNAEAGTLKIQAAKLDSERSWYPTIATALMAGVAIATVIIKVL